MLGLVKAPVAAPTPAPIAAPASGAPTNAPPTAPLPKEWAKFKGLHLNGDRTLLRYTVAGAEVLESPWIEYVDLGKPVWER